jgi:hypothetical protein
MELLDCRVLDVRIVLEVCASVPILPEFGRACGAGFRCTTFGLRAEAGVESSSGIVPWATPVSNLR